MTVSLLQLEDAPFRRLPARGGGENPNHKRAGAANRVITRLDEGHPPSARGSSANGGEPHAVGAGVRRQEVKPQPKLTPKAAKPAVKAKPVGKAAQGASKPSKAAAKSLAAKVLAKSTATPAGKGLAGKAPAAVRK